MDIEQLTPLFVELRKWSRENEEKITKKRRAKYFFEDLALIIFLFEENGFNKEIIDFKRQQLPKRLINLFGIKQSSQKENSQEEIE